MILYDYWKPQVKQIVVLSQSEGTIQTFDEDARLVSRILGISLGKTRNRIVVTFSSDMLKTCVNQLWDSGHAVFVARRLT